MIQIRIPSIGQEAAGDSEKVHTVFQIEVLNNGRKHLVERRYRDFQALHKKLKKTTKTPDFPPKRGLNRRPKALEQKRIGLEAYLQGLVCDNQHLSREILDFLNIKHIPPGKQTNTLSILEQLDLQNYRCFCHQVVTFTKDAFAHPNTADLLPNVTVMGVLQGLYLSDPETQNGVDSAGTVQWHIPGPESIV